ncbi:MAG: hypothetical protein HC834_09225 [Rhodospirillales bacterium]|nr:hypothetical protein [Rhodospirillales bacterium]
MGTLFNARMLADVLRGRGDIPPVHTALTARWAESVRDSTIRGQNETQVEGDFKGRILEAVLGYASFGSDRPQTVKAKVAIGTGIVDLALGRFDGPAPVVLAPFELKGARTVDLDAPMPGRRITPVQQAWQYAVAAPGVRWVLVSNMCEIRLYAFGEGLQSYERFDLARLDTPEDYHKLVLLLSAENLLGGATEALLDRSRAVEKEITERLYGDYTGLRTILIEAVDVATGRADKVAAIGTAQKVLDRVLFVAFAEDTGLLPPRSLAQAHGHRNPYDPRPIWRNFQALFRAIDSGSAALNIPRYNGGLFRPDPAVDALDLPDAICDGFMTLGAYDFGTEVSVTVLGHIFEQSVTDVERLLSRPAASSRRRRKRPAPPAAVSATASSIRRTISPASSWRARSAPISTRCSAPPWRAMPRRATRPTTRR